MTGPVPVATATAKLGGVGVYLEAIGTVTPIYTDSITAQVTGHITAVRYREGQFVHKGDPLSDVANVMDSTQDLRTAGYTDGVRSVTVLIFRQPGANIIDTVSRIRAQLPFLQAVLPQGIHFTIVLHRTTTIPASLHDVQTNLVVSTCLVVAVGFFFFRRP